VQPGFGGSPESASAVSQAAESASAASQAAESARAGTARAGLGVQPGFGGSPESASAASAAAEPARAGAARPGLGVQPGFGGSPDSASPAGESVGAGVARAGLGVGPGFGSSPESASAAGQTAEPTPWTARAGLGREPGFGGSPDAAVQAAEPTRAGTALQAGPGGPATLLAAQPVGWFGLVGQTSPVGQTSSVRQAAAAGRSAEPVTQAFAARQPDPSQSAVGLATGSASDAIDRPTAVDAAIGLGTADGRPDASDAPGIVAFRPRPEIPAGDEQAAQQADADRARIGRVLRGASLSRLKRPGAPADRSSATGEGTGQGTDRPEAERDWNAAAASADAATWAAGELPGQAAITDTAV
jgi:hypothetical protein